MRNTSLWPLLYSLDLRVSSSLTKFVKTMLSECLSPSFSSETLSTMEVCTSTTQDGGSGTQAGTDFHSAVGSSVLPFSLLSNFFSCMELMESRLLENVKSKNE